MTKAYKIWSADLKLTFLCFGDEREENGIHNIINSSETF